MNPSIDPARIRRLAEDLARPRQDIEIAFVAVGARLTEGAALLNSLSKLFEALPEALQGEEVDEAVAHLTAVAERADILSRTFGQEKADLARLVEVVGAASAPIADLRKAVKMMGIVSVNARVTAAGIVGDSDDFDVFTTDIATLSDSASRTIQEFAQVYRQLTNEVDRAASQRARFETAHSHTLSGLAESLAETIAALDRQRSAAMEASAETGRVSRQIVGRIGSAVMALQVGDATRQRIEHVETGLARIAEIAAGNDVEAADRPAAIAALTTLQQLQLTDTAAAFAQEVGQAEQDLKALANDAGTIMARSRDFHGDERGESSAIASLSAQLRAAVTILRDFEAERAKLETVASAVQKTVRVLLDHVGAVQDIEANMRLVSLNAAVRCAQLGPRGASLTVIAMQLRELTSETVVAAEAAMTQLDQSSALAGAFGAAAGGKGTGRIADLEDQANLALDILGKLDQRIAAALAKLNHDGPRVITLLDGAARGLSGQSDLAETLDDVALTIAGLGEAGIPPALPDSLAGILAQLRKLYTMEAERMIHDRLFPASAAAGSSGPEPEADLDAFML
ncbi:MAG: hypothetical protein ABS76_20040 [Pelagibacterium sp. SCN 64-44]|nr:MAG: hypothetical protein ABS76_20040 [Pelagibacterium sp. SCN 64-44]